MPRLSRVVLCIALLCLRALPAWTAQDGIPVPALRGPVTDQTGTLSAQQRAQLERRLLEFEASEGSQLAVLLVPTTQPETIEQYSIRVAEAWRLGRQGTDDGVLLLVAKNDRAVRLEVGYGLEGALPDAIANRITDQVIVPRFREGDFYGGIDAAVTRIIAVIKGEPLPEPAASQPTPPGIVNFLPVLLMLVFVVGGVLRRVLGSFGGAAATGGLAGVMVWLLTGVMAVSIGAGIVAFLFTVLGVVGGGSGWANTRRRGSGGWGTGGGWGGGFGGGFGGGGGGFGGGGATGRW